MVLIRLDEREGFADFHLSSDKDVQIRTCRLGRANRVRGGRDHSGMMYSCIEQGLLRASALGRCCRDPGMGHGGFMRQSPWVRGHASGKFGPGPFDSFAKEA